MARAKKPAPVEEVEEVEEVVETEVAETEEVAEVEEGAEVETEAPAKKTFRVRVTHGGHSHKGKVYGKSDGPFETEEDLPKRWPEKFTYA